MSTPNYFAEFDYGAYYHIFNRSNNKERIFIADEDYQHFLTLFNKYLGAYLDVYAYCLLPNHFHFMVSVKAASDITLTNDNLYIDDIITEQFRKFFINYSQWFNKKHFRSGNLFHRRFKRLFIDSESHYTQLICYIHLNPLKHKVQIDYENYPWSSYKAILSNAETKLKRNDILDFFGSKLGFENAHIWQEDLYTGSYIIED
ncbi:MAG: transposase [Bacteroidetes bacterium]|nr:transposase [Bacteroidota bacterium]